jgi:hypothetical protein
MMAASPQYFQQSSNLAPRIFSKSFRNSIYKLSNLHHMQYVLSYDEMKVCFESKSILTPLRKREVVPHAKSSSGSYFFRLVTFKELF